jgi:perosamine synthetase
LRIVEDAPGRTTRIPLAAPNISSDDREAVSSSLLGKSIAYGETVGRFEHQISTLLGCEHGVATQSGTAALHLALIVSGIKPGDEVLMPTLTYVAPANAVRYVGAHPVFLDVEDEYRQLDLSRAEQFVSREYRNSAGIMRNRRSGRPLTAVLAIDLLGHPCDLHGVLDFAERFGLVVIDDAAEAFGASLRGAPVGSLAPVSILSFNANKILTTAGGGMLICHKEQHAERARLLSTHAKAVGAAVYNHTEVGFNYGMASAQAALGLSQLDRLEEFLARKRAIAARYDRTFAATEEIVLPGRADWAEPSCWLYTIHVPAAARDLVIDLLRQEGIETRPMFMPMHLVAAHRACEADSCPSAERLSRTGISLPCSTDATNAEVDEVAEAVLLALERVKGADARSPR